MKDKTFQGVIYSIFLYLFRRQEVSLLWFGLLCLSICLRIAVLGEKMANELLPWLSWEWGVKIEYIAAAIGTLAVVGFVNKQYPNEIVRFAFPLIAVGFAAMCIWVIATPAKIYTTYMLPLQLILFLPSYLNVSFISVLYQRASTVVVSGQTSQTSI